MPSVDAARLRIETRLEVAGAVQDGRPVHASRLWARRDFIQQWSTVEGHRSHRSHYSSRGGWGHGNSYHGNSHSSSHRSHYSSRSSSSSGGGSYSSGSGSNLPKRAIYRVIWNDEDRDDDGDGIPDKTRRTSTTSSTTTIPIVNQEQFIQQEWRYETCWFDDGDLGAPIVLQLRNAKGEWRDVKAPTARTNLKRFEMVDNSKCNAERPHSAVTTWAPSEPGVYYLRHYYVGFKTITTGFPYEEIIVLVVR